MSTPESIAHKYGTQISDFLISHDDTRTSHDIEQHWAPTILSAIREALAGQLPVGMEHCTIKFCECEKGHGWLTATNWIQHGCPTCERDTLRTQQETLWDQLRQRDEEFANLRSEVERLKGALTEAADWASNRLAVEGHPHPDCMVTIVNWRKLL